MADSTREAALNALKTVIDAATAATVLRNMDVPEVLPAAGLVVITDGEARGMEETLSPLRFHHEHAARITLVAEGTTEALRDAALDALLQAVAGAVTANPTLSSAVEWAQPEAPNFDTAVQTGARGKAAQFDVVLYFSTLGSAAV